VKRKQKKNNFLTLNGMILRIKDTFVDTTSILLCEMDTYMITIVLKGAMEPYEIVFKNDEECLNNFNQLCKRMNVKNIDEKTINKKSTIKDDKRELFDTFWDLYQKKVGYSKCLEKWMKLGIPTISKIIKAVPKYVKDTPDVKYRKNPLTWLNGNYWEDEPIKEMEKEKENFNHDELF
jgi:hypothetical protein